VILWDEFFFFSQWAELSSFVYGKEKPDESRCNNKPFNFFNPGVPKSSEEILLARKCLLGCLHFLNYFSLSATEN